MNAATPPTPENVAEMLTDGDNDYHDGNDWKVSLYAIRNLVNIGITPFADDEDGTRLPQVPFRAIVVEGEAVPIVLAPPAELGIQWEDGGDLLALTADGIVLTPRGVDVWELNPSEARELAAHLAAMADAHESAGDDR